MTSEKWESEGAYLILNYKYRILDRLDLMLFWGSIMHTSIVPKMQTLDKLTRNPWDAKRKKWKEKKTLPSVAPPKKMKISLKVSLICKFINSFSFSQEGVWVCSLITYKHRFFFFWWVLCLKFSRHELECTISCLITKIFFWNTILFDALRRWYNQEIKPFIKIYAGIAIFYILGI